MFNCCCRNLTDVCLLKPGGSLYPPPRTRPGRILENNFARYVVRNQTETAEDAESTSEHQRLQQYAISGFPLNLSCLMVSFSCVLVYSLGNRTPESENKQTSVYLIKRKIKKENFGIRTRARETRPGAMTSSALPHGSALHL